MTESIDVSSTGVISVRVKKGGANHRYTLPPGSSLDNQPQEVRDAAAEAWTADVLAAYALATAQPERTIEEARSAAMGRIESQHRQRLSAINARYPESEQRHWHVLYRIASRGSGAALERYAAVLGVSVADAADRVLAAAEPMELLYAEATAITTAQRDQLDAAETIEEMDAVAAE